MIQQLIVIFIFVAALGYLGTRMWKTLRRPEAGGCGKGCVHATPKPPASPTR